MGFTQVSQSAELMPMVRIVPRGQTSCVDAYLTPLILKYVDGFAKGFDDQFDKVKVYFMMSDGGLCPVHQFRGFRAILSGPAGNFIGLFHFIFHFCLLFHFLIFILGGVVGYSVTTFNKETKQPVIGFDMVCFFSLGGVVSLLILIIIIGRNIHRCISLCWQL